MKFLEFNNLIPTGAICSPTQYLIVRSCLPFQPYGNYLYLYAMEKGWGDEQIRFIKLEQVQMKVIENFEVDKISRKWPKYAKVAKINPRLI